MNKATRRILSAMNALKGSIDPSATEAPVEAEQSASIDEFYQRMFDRDIYLHVSEISVAMLGVCLTGVSILNVDQENSKGNSGIDDLLAIDSFVFLTAYLLSYWVIRVMTKGNRNIRRIGNVASIIFLFGMILMAIVCGCIVLQGDFTHVAAP
jgi:hypothetical protein